MRRSRAFLLCLFLIPFLMAWGEEDLARSTLGMDISTASFYELSEWLSSLKLSTSGSLAELRARLYEHYRIDPPAEKAAGERSIRIESAERTEYGENSRADPIMRLMGGVSLLVTQNGEEHRISAREIVYDRERNALSARGAVRYSRQSAGVVEEFTGEVLAVDLDDWGGVFLDGRIRREGAELAEYERGLVFSAETMVKKPGEVIAFSNGRVSSCDEEDPHFSIRAGRMWLLPNNDWAMSDVVLNVGEVPLLWLPFFYNPSDEILFHPVLGYKSREGRYVQTTTYLLGEKPPPAEPTGILRFAPKEGKKEVSGLFLKTVKGEPEKGGSNLKLMLDLYSGLGGFGGVEGSFPSLGSFNKVKFQAGIGISRSLFSLGGYYSPFVAAGNYASLWNRSDFLGIGLPVRFGLEGSAETKLGPLSLALNLPLYSDPFFDQDFKNRKEDMNWLGIGEDEEADSKTITKRSSFSQKLSLTGSLKTDAFKPWVDSFRISKLESNLSWMSKSSRTAAGTPDASVLPAREFYYPELFKPVDMGLEMKGSLFEYPVKRASGRAGGSEANRGAGQNPDGGGELPPGGRPPPPPATQNLRKPWEEAEKALGPKTGAKADTLGFRVPPPAPAAPKTAEATGSSAKVDWRLNPSVVWENRGASESWSSPEEIDGELLYELVSWKLSGGLSGSAKSSGDSASASLGLTFSAQDQVRESSDDPAFAAKVRSYESIDAQFESGRLSSALKLSSKLFPAGSPLASSSVSYGLDSIIYSHSYSSMANGLPVYNDRWFSWSKESVTAHSVEFLLGLRAGGETQSLSFGASLPPLRESYSLRLNLGSSWAGVKGSLSASSALKRDEDSGALKLDPISANSKLSMQDGPSLSEALVYDPDLKELNSSTLAINWGGFSGALTARRAKAYTPDPAKGWTAVGEEGLRLSELKLGLKLEHVSPKDAAWQTSLSSNANYSQSLLRFSESSLSLNLGASARLGKEFSLGFSMLSQNSSVWRYWPGLFLDDHSGLNPDDYLRPFLTDLLESLAFWDRAARTRALFKLKSFSLKLTQDLHDWKLSCSATVSPYLDTTERRYTLDPSISLSVAWKEMPDIKSDISYTRTGLSY